MIARRALELFLETHEARLKPTEENLLPTCVLCHVNRSKSGVFYVGHGKFQSDRHAVPPVPEVVLRSLGILPRQEITYTCVPPGSGRRIGIDRDEDGVFDGDEADAGSDPADPHDPPFRGSK